MHAVEACGEMEVHFRSVEWFVSFVHRVPIEQGPIVGLDALEKLNSLTPARYLAAISRMSWTIPTQLPRLVLILYTKRLCTEFCPDIMSSL